MVSYLLLLVLFTYTISGLMGLILAVLLAIAPPPNNPLTFPGDTEFSRRDYPAAIAAYESALKSSTDSAEVYWRLARVQICLGDIAEGDQTEHFYRAAEEFARASLRLDSTKAEPHTWLAVALGSVAMFEGSNTKVQLCIEIKCHLDIAIAINPNDDVAYSILGSFYTALGNISWLERQLANVFLGHLPDGGYEQAEQAFKRAIALAPNVIRHHYALGMLYRTLDRHDEARIEFEKASALPILLARDIHDQQAARELVKEMTASN
jgi:tetratricopeptide (TPR) repeat protein